MLFSFVILPLCILYMQEGHAAIPFGGVGKGFLVAGAVLWAMLYMLLSQFAFPRTLSGALLATGGLYVSSAVGEMAAKQDKDTWNLYESYIPFVALGLIGSLLTAMVIALWET